MLSKQLLVLLIVAGVVAALFYMSHAKRQKSRREITALIVELSETQHNKEEVRGLLREPRFRDLTLREEPSNDWSVETPSEFGAKNWVLYMEMNDSKVTAVRIRIADSAAIHPKGAPPDKIFP